MNSHDCGLSKALSEYKFPRVTYVLFGPNLLPAAFGAAAVVVGWGGSWRRNSWSRVPSGDVSAHAHTKSSSTHTHAVSVWRHTHAPKHLLRIITNPLRCLNLELFGSQCYLSWAYMTHQWEKYSKFEQRGRRESLTNNNVFRLWFFAARLCSQTGYCSSRKDQCHQMTRPLLHINISR